jgi:hypothetical protein
LAKLYKSVLYILFLVLVSEYLPKFFFKLVVVLEDFLSELLLVFIVDCKELLLNWFELPEYLALESRGCEENLTFIVVELILVVFKVGFYSSKEPSKSLPIASILSGKVNPDLFPNIASGPIGLDIDFVDSLL